MIPKFLDAQSDENILYQVSSVAWKPDIAGPEARVADAYQ